MKKQIVIPAIYLLIVLTSLLVAFDFDGSIRSSAAWLAAVVLTLPWSILSIIFIWALIHGAGLEFFTVMYLSFASLNAYILHRMLRPGAFTRFLYGKGNRNLD